ncbi:MAG: DUF4340 domain-containing protein [Planctomycetota bacterium]
MNLTKANIVLLVAAAALAIPTGMQVAGDAESFVDYERVPLLFDGFTADNVGFVQMSIPKKEQPPVDPQKPDQKPPVAYDHLFVQRTEKGFALAPQQPGSLAGAPVAKDRVQQDVFEHIGKIRDDKQTRIAQGASEEKLKEYGLDEAHATLIRLSDRSGQNVIASLYVGRDAGKLGGTESVRGVFVRKTDSSDVVVYEFDKGWRRDTNPETWIDKVLLKLAPEAVTRLSLQNGSNGGQPMVLTRGDTKASWTAATTPAGRSVLRQGEVEAFLNRLRWISAQDFKMPMTHAKPAELGLLPPQIALEITWRDGDTERTSTFQVGKRLDGDQNVYYFTSSEVPFLMTWPAGMVTPLEVDTATWFDPVAPTGEPGKDAPKDDKKPDEKKEDGKK